MSEVRNTEIRNRLEELSEEKYREFTSSLIPDFPKERILGVRIPDLRRLAAGIAKGDWRDYLRDASCESHEEIMLQGMVIGYARMDGGERLERIFGFLPEICNWAVCDSFCSGLKFARSDPERVWEFIRPLFADDGEYKVRFAVVMLLDYYVSERYLEEALNILDGIRHDSYYVKMAVAWAVSIYFVRFPKETMRYLRTCRLDDFTYRKSLQKICESRQVDQGTREEIRRMRKRDRTEESI